MKKISILFFVATLICINIFAFQSSDIYEQILNTELNKKAYTFGYEIRRLVKINEKEEIMSRTHFPQLLSELELLLETLNFFKKNICLEESQLLEKFIEEGNERKDNISYHWWLHYAFRASYILTAPQKRSGNLANDDRAPEETEGKPLIFDFLVKIVEQNWWHSYESFSRIIKEFGNDSLFDFLLLKYFPHAILYPTTKSNFSLSDCNRLNGTGIFLIGIADCFGIFDGRSYEPDDAFRHDINHAVRNFFYNNQFITKYPLFKEILLNARKNWEIADIKKYNIFFFLHIDNLYKINHKLAKLLDFMYFHCTHELEYEEHLLKGNWAKIHTKLVESQPLIKSDLWYGAYYKEFDPKNSYEEWALDASTEFSKAFDAAKIAYDSKSK